MWATVVVVALLHSGLGAHNASQGKSAFVVHDNGKIDVHVELLEIDLPELCDVEINLADPVRREAALQKLEACVARDFPTWLRLRIDDAPCRIIDGRFTHGPGLRIDLDADALCDEPRGHTLMLDWGLFQSSSLDHQSTTTVKLPDGTTRRALLSKRKNKLTIELPDHQIPAAAAAAAGTAAVVAAFAAVFFLWRRRRRR